MELVSSWPLLVTPQKDVVLTQTRRWHSFCQGFEGVLSLTQPQQQNTERRNIFPFLQYRDGSLSKFLCPPPVRLGKRRNNDLGIQFLPMETPFTHLVQLFTSQATAKFSAMVQPHGLCIPMFWAFSYILCDVSNKITGLVKPPRTEIIQYVHFIPLTVPQLQY